MKIVYFVVITGALIWGVGSIVHIVSVDAPRYNPSGPTSEHRRTPLRVYRASEIPNYFADNEMTAEHQFKDTVGITGRIESIETDAITGGLRVTLGMTIKEIEARVKANAGTHLHTAFPEIVCNVSKGSRAEFEGLHSGENIEINAWNGERTAGVFVSFDCTWPRFVN